MAMKGHTRFVLTGVHRGRTASFVGGRYNFVDGALELLTSSLKPGTHRILRSLGAVPEAELEQEDGGDGGGEVQVGGADGVGGEEVDGGAGEEQGLPPDEAPVLLQGDVPAQAGTSEHVPGAEDGQGADSAGRRRRRR